MAHRTMLADSAPYGGERRETARDPGASGAPQSRIGPRQRIINHGLEITAGRDPKRADGEGDLNGDCYIDLRDVIMALQVSSGMALSGMVTRMENDVNRDQKINLIEAIYLLQRIAGIRGRF